MCPAKLFEPLPGRETLPQHPAKEMELEPISVKGFMESDFFYPYNSEIKCVNDTINLHSCVTE